MGLLNEGCCHRATSIKFDTFLNYKTAEIPSETWNVKNYISTQGSMGE